MGLAIEVIATRFVVVRDKLAILAKWMLGPLGSTPGKPRRGQAVEACKPWPADPGLPGSCSRAERLFCHGISRNLGKGSKHGIMTLASGALMTLAHR